MVKNYKTLVVKVKAATDKLWNFKDIAKFIDGKKIKGIKVYSAADLSYSSEGVAMIPADELKNLFLTLKNTDGQEIFDMVPLSDFTDPYNYNKIPVLDDLELNLTECKIENKSGQNLTASRDIMVRFEF